MQVNQSTLKAISVNFNALFNKVFSDKQPQYQKVATTVPSSAGSENYKWLGNIPGMREWVGSRVIQNLEGYGYEIRNKDFELTIGVNRNDIEDDTLGIYNPMISSIAEAAALHPDELIFNLAKNGFASKCFDGKNFYATDHKVGRNTYSNKGTAKLTAESYQTARATMMGYKDENGKSLNIIPNLLVVPPALESAALRILKAETIEGTTNINRDTAEVLVVPELSGSDTAWHLMCTTKAIKPFIFQERKKPKFISLTNDTDENVFMRKEFLYGVESRDNAGYGLWQLSYGSDGSADK